MKIIKVSVYEECEAGMTGIESMMGMVKIKGGTYCLHPERFMQIREKHLILYELLRREMIGFAIYNEFYWIICREDAGVYIRVPFARSEVWFDAITSEPECMAIRALPQIYITGVG